MESIVVVSTNGIARSITDWIPSTRVAIIHALDNLTAFNILQSISNTKLLVADAEVSDLPITTFLQCVHTIPNYNTLPIVFVAQPPPTNAIDRLLKIENTYYLPKPVNKDHFLLCAEKHIIQE